MSTALTRMALFAEQGHPDGTFQSGVTRLTDRLSRGSASRGVEVDYFTYLPEADERVRDGIRYWAAEPRLRARFHGLEVDALDIVPTPNPRLTAGARGRDYDVVVGTSPGIGTQGQILARRRGIPFVGIYTTDLPHYAEALAAALPTAELRKVAGGAARGFAHRYIAWLYDRRRTDLVLVPTRAFRQELTAFVDACTAVLGRGADTLRFDPIQRPVGDRVRALYVGRIDYGQKNLAALEPLLEQVPELDLWMVGGGDDLPRLRERLADAEAAGRVRITGRIEDQEALRDVYAGADLFVFPSLSDTLGQVVLEAQAAGLPVVVRDRGGPQELIVHGKTGLVTTSDEAFRSSVARLARDPELRRVMGTAAWKHARSAPTWDDVIDQFLAYLGEVVDVPR